MPKTQLALSFEPCYSQPTRVAADKNNSASCQAKELKQEGMRFTSLSNTNICTRYGSSTRTWQIATRISNLIEILVYGFSLYKSEEGEYMKERERKVSAKTDLHKLHKLGETYLSIMVFVIDSYHAHARIQLQPFCETKLKENSL